MHSKETLHFSSVGRNWEIQRPTDLESLWETIANENNGDAFAADERLPYWVELWPSSMALADWIMEHKERIVDKDCLDLGCGLGFTALVGALTGGAVTGFDYEPAALHYARINARINGFSSFETSGPVPVEPFWLVMDWRSPAVRKGSFPVIWAGDIMYEKRFTRPVAAFLDHALSPDGVMWLAEPGRGIYNDFALALGDYGFCSERKEERHVTAFEGHAVSVRIWEIYRKST